MPPNFSKNEKVPTVADLYPQLSLEEQKQAEFNLHRYLLAVKRIFERIKRENPDVLTELENRARLKKKNGLI